MSDMDSLMTGDLSEDDGPRYKGFQENMREFKATVGEIVHAHKEARSVRLT